MKGWYECDYCGQLKEHPLMDAAEDELKDNNEREFSQEELDAGLEW